MSKSSEDAALKAYPSDTYSGGKSCRRAYKEGYEQAEKDTIERALSWLKYAQEKHMALDGTIAYFKAVMEE